MQKNNIRIISLGSDPEYFIQDSKGNPLSSIGLVGGSKKSPKPLGSGFFIQEDNVALEMNIPPAKTRSEFIANMKNSLTMANGVLSGDKFISRKPSFDFPDSQLNGKGARDFGCEPDYSPWLMETNSVETLKGLNFRSAGGHIHLGYDSDVGVDMGLTFAIAKALDLFIGVPSVIIDREGQKRREFYGKNGALRMKDYGMEYRTVSNFWCFDSNLIGWVWDSVNAAIQFINSSGEDPLDDVGGEVLSCINNGMISTARSLVEKFSIEMPEKSEVYEKEKR